MIVVLVIASCTAGSQARVDGGREELGRNHTRTLWSKVQAALHRHGHGSDQGMYRLVVTEYLGADGGGLVDDFFPRLHDSSPDFLRSLHGHPTRCRRTTDEGLSVRGCSDATREFDVLVRVDGTDESRQDLLVATRHILQSDLKTTFVGQINTLLDHNVLVGAGVTGHESLRSVSFPPPSSPSLTPALQSPRLLYARRPHSPRPCRAHSPPA